MKGDTDANENQEARMTSHFLSGSISQMTKSMWKAKILSSCNVSED